ncbi:MAG TPA: serine/threonine-protein phosphatase, partial [Pirellulaceae bacterium]|nr:serine/threonine-protein phosphatase [Pirellulaceae bacterium]
MSDSFVKWDTYLTVASLSDVGLRRTTNQDNLCISLASNLETWQRRGHLFVVADGMGGNAAGDLASKIAVDTIPHLYNKLLDGSPVEAIRRSLSDTNAEIYRRGQANEEFQS